VCAFFLCFLLSAFICGVFLPSFLPSVCSFVRSLQPPPSLLLACCWLTSVTRTLFFRVVDCAPRAHTLCRLSLCGWPAARHPIQCTSLSPFEIGKERALTVSLAHHTMPKNEGNQSIDRSTDRADCVCSFALSMISTTAITNLTALLSLSWPCFGGIAGTSPHLPQRTSSCRSFVCHDFCCTSRDRD